MNELYIVELCILVMGIIIYYLLNKISTQLQTLEEQLDSVGTKKDEDDDKK